QTDAQNGVNAIAASPYCNLLPGMQTLYVRVGDAAAPACASFTTLELIVNPVPVANPSIPAYRLCDVNDSGDDTEGFILSSWDAQVSGGAAGVVVSYHLSLADAQAGVGAIDPNVPYQNISNPQQICARIEYPSSGCYDTGCFDLMVDPLPQAFEPAPVNLCSGLVPGQAEFNLSANDAQASGGIPGRIVSYHLTLADAQTGSGALASPYTNASNPQTLFVRVEDAATGCFDTTTLTLSVSEGPGIFPPAALHVCDPNNDGFAAFDLSLADDDVMGGGVPPGVTITYHETQTDAQNGVNAFVSPYGNINPYLQTIWVRAEFDATGCASYTTLALIVHDTPQATAVDPLHVCDGDGDGVGSFDLNLATAGILGGLDPAQHTVTYHISQAHAQAGTPFIAGTAAYTSANGSVWVRVEQDDTGCFD